MLGINGAMIRSLDSFSFEELSQAMDLVRQHKSALKKHGDDELTKERVREANKRLTLLGGELKRRKNLRRAQDKTNAAWNKEEARRFS